MTLSTAGLIAVGGKITPPDEAKISVLDRGFLFGDNVFETFVAFHKTILDLEAHLERLRSSADQLGMSIPWSNAELSFELSTLAEQVEAPKKMLRLVVTRGEGLGLAVLDTMVPNRVAYCFPATLQPSRVYQEGLRLKRLGQGVTERGAAAKTGNYLSSIVALKKAKESAFDDVLWTNAEGEVTEASTANIFFIGREGDQVAFTTPPPRSGLLLGITRGTIIRLMENAKLPVHEEIVYADELAKFDEAFVSSTVRGLVPIRQIDDHQLHTTRPNSVFQHINRLYDTWIETQLGYRVDWNSGIPTKSSE